MSDPSDQGEPTMEEILASIRKIISEDDPEAGAEEVSTAEEAAPDDVLELTERVEDEAGKTEEDEIDAILASVTGGGDEMENRDTGAARSGGLVSPETDAAVTAALSDFAGALMEQGKGQDGPVGDNQALDSLVRAALEPYLRGWLDEHLETLVERVLREEIKRMARRAENV
ncbi:MAG: DUF2497 domain-containing protein [Rhodospirillales bacterium]|nr:DUF2497 domain-containing protein [Rhodospirillales bacterium]MDH3912146.1 DUF2497 domain-containing protein [Rhodospirillales bacterium]